MLFGFHLIWVRIALGPFKWSSKGRNRPYPLPYTWTARNYRMVSPQGQKTLVGYGGSLRPWLQQGTLLPPSPFPQADISINRNNYTYKNQTAVIFLSFLHPASLVYILSFSSLELYCYQEGFLRTGEEGGLYIMVCNPANKADIRQKAGLRFQFRP